MENIKNKNILRYGLVLTLGLLVGYFIFGNRSEQVHEHNNTSDNQQMWTCSMHPQIMQPEPGQCPICGMDLIPADATADGLGADQFRMTENAMALANVQTSIVGGPQGIGGSRKLSGKILENESSNAVQVSYFEGRIERLNISFTGEKVNSGQLLASIYSPNLYAAQQELLTASQLKTSQPALYKAVRNKLKLWKLSDKQIDQIEASGKVIQNFPVYATVSGTVTEKLVEQGDYVKQGQPLLRIADLNSVWASFDVYESSMGQFKKGQTIEISTNAYPSEKFSATVQFVDPIMNQQTRTFQVRAELLNKEGKLKPGMFVEATITESSTGMASNLVIPVSAVLWTGTRSVVYVKIDPSNPVFEMREIELGAKQGDYYIVIEGLKDGEEIVTNGTFTVDAAAQLQGKKSMMNESDANINDQPNDSLPRFSVDPSFQLQLLKALKAYILIKDALVASDASLAKKEASAFLIVLEKIDMGLLKENAAHLAWMPLLNALKKQAETFEVSTDLENQRKQFKPLSQSMSQAIQQFGVQEKVYLEFCPMADDYKGGHWLSLEKEIRNPYYGDAMLRCGEVQKVID